MFPIRLLVVASVVLFAGVSAAQEKKPAQYIKLTAEVRGNLEQPLLGGDVWWRAAFVAKGGGSLRMAVQVGDEGWVLSLPDDGVMPKQAAGLVGKEVLIQGTVEPAPPGFHGMFPPAGLAGSHFIRVSSITAADAK